MAAEAATGRRSQAAQVKGKHTVTLDHPHNWAISPPNGPTSTGVCRTCGETREFKNSLPNPNYKNVKTKTIKELVAIRKAAAEEWEQWHGRLPNEGF